MKAKRPVVLTILDGFGYSTVLEGNAVYHAHKPNFDHLISEYPSTLIEASGPWVGLPQGQMGNSEVGHLNIGSGRIIQMDVTKIDAQVATLELRENAVLKGAMEYARGKRLHLLGLLSDGGVHSHIDHLIGILKIAKLEGVADVAIHCFMDGRDTPPHNGVRYLQQLQQQIAEIGVGTIASVIGRYYAMDRDKRWERVERAFDAIVLGQAEKAQDPIAAVKASYEKGVTDEFIEPVVIVDPQQQPVGLIRDGDAVFFYNFRADRGRELTMALLDPTLEKPARSKAPKNLHYITMTQYDKSFTVPYVISNEPPKQTLGQVLSEAGLRNLRTAETEKYPHVTYFFNGGIEKPYTGEERELIASPKVATYDLKPEMSAFEVCEVVERGLKSNSFDVIVVNFANPDMVGHSGKFEAARQAVEACDLCLGRIYPLIKERDAAWIVTADHGNSETMIDPATGGPHTYHTTNPVPLLIASGEKVPLRKGGSLRDIAPTILGLVGLPKPAEMTGEDLRIIGD